jgi:hypothetical protein
LSRHTGRYPGHRRTAQSGYPRRFFIGDKNYFGADFNEGVPIFTASKNG